VANLTRIKRIVSDAYFNNSWVKPADSSLATLSVSATVPADLTASATMISATGVANHMGGISTSNGTALVLTTTTRNDASTFTYSGVIELNTNDSKIAIGLTTTSVEALVEINGTFVSKTPVTASGSGTQYLVIDFGSTSAKRFVRVFTTAPFRFIYRHKNYNVWAPAKTDVIRMAVAGDSYVAATGADSVFHSWVSVLGYRMGIRDIRAIGIGGFGWVQNGSGTAWKLGSHLFDITNINPDMIVIAMGTNDAAYVGSITAEALADLRTIRAANPSALIFVMGTWPQATGPSGTLQTVETEVKAAVTQLNDPYVAFVPVILDPAGSWITGTGKSGSPYSGSITCTVAPSAATSCTLTSAFTGPTSTAYSITFSDNSVHTATLTNGSTTATWATAATANVTATYTHANAGSADIYQGGADGQDGVHWNTAGHDYGAGRAADAIIAAILAMPG